MKPLACLLALMSIAAGHLAAQPVVSNVRASQRAGTPLVDIYYDLTSSSNALAVYAQVSINGGATYDLPAYNFTGAVGAGVAPGLNQKITWNAGQDWPTNFSSNVRFRVTADDAVPDGMALIPAGSFTMGTAFPNEDVSGELPAHIVYVSAFYLDKQDVTKSLWDSVYQWAIANGYAFDNPGSGKATNHPVQSVNWYDAVKWCNARSQLAGLTPVYYTDAGFTQIYTNGDAANIYANWPAKGYRLPTEAEWEKAARGGLAGHRFPWGDLISESNANYYGNTTVAYDLGPNGYNTNFATGLFPYTSPVGWFAPNGYGVSDLAGNVWQWCWDWYGAYPSGEQFDPRGSASGQYRISRGGGMGNNGTACRTAFRESDSPAFSEYDIGFRCVLAPNDVPVITVQPVDHIVTKGATVTFSVTAAGGSPIYYQWQSSGVNIPGATGSSLTLTNVQTAGYYSVVINNGEGIVVSRSAHLSLHSLGEL